MNRYCFLLVSALIPTLLLASSKDLPSDFYQQVDRFLERKESMSEPLIQEAYQIVEHLTEATENNEEFIEKVKVLKSHLRLVCDFTQPQTLQRTLLIEKEINTRVTAWNQEAQQKRSTITWTALAIGVLIGLFGGVVRAVQKERLDGNQLKTIGTQILLWAPFTIGGGLGLGTLIAEKEVEQRQVLLVHPTELIRVHWGDVATYEIESHLKAFLTAEKESSRAQARKKLHALHSKAPERVESRIQYMKQVLEHAPQTQKLSPSKKEQQEQLEALQKRLSLQFPSPSSWLEIRYFISDHLYGLSIVGALLGVAIFLFSLHLRRDWSWPSAVLSILIGLNVGLSLGQMAGDVIKKERSHDLLHHEVLF